MSPAITVSGERGIVEADGMTCCEMPNEGDTVTFSDWVETGEVIVDGEEVALDGTIVMVLLIMFFIDGLLAVTKYCPGCKSPRNS
jgi:hypothetical protein